MYSLLKTGVALMLALMLSACGDQTVATRAAMPDYTRPGLAPRDVRIESFTVSVPRSLTVNERNLYYPRADIVWRGDPAGDRHSQVRAMFESGLSLAAARLEGGRPMRIDVQVLRFHGLSEKARYTVGGVHDIAFRYRLIDIGTGLQFGPTRTVQADLRALGGKAALDADAQGQTQKARIVAHLGQVFVEELSLPGGHRNASLGLLQAINEF